MSIALQHQQRVLQQRQEQADDQRIKEAAQDTIEATASEYDQFQLLVSSLDKDVARLHGLSLDDKNRIRREELIPLYRPYCREYREKGEAYKNPILVQMLIWLFDVGDIHEALFWAYFAIEQQQPLPDRFRRKDLTTFVADAVLEWADLQEKRNESIEPYFSEVFQRLTEHKWPMPDAVRAKYHVKAGDHAQESGKLQQALDHFIKASELDPRRTKRKTAISKIRAGLAKQKADAS